MLCSPSAYSTVNQLESSKNKIQKITAYMLWCFPPLPLCDISCSLTWRGLTSQPGPHPNALLILSPHFSSPFYATMKTNSLQLCPPHTIFVSCLQAVPFSHFLFILLFSLTFWSLLADMHSINCYMTVPQPG